MKNKNQKIFSTVAVAQRKRPIKNKHIVALRHCHTKGFVFFTVPECLARLFARGHKQKVLAHRLTCRHAEGWQGLRGGCIRARAPCGRLSLHLFGVLPAVKNIGDENGIAFDLVYDLVIALYDPSVGLPHVFEVFFLLPDVRVHQKFIGLCQYPVAYLVHFFRRHLRRKKIHALLQTGNGLFGVDQLHCLSVGTLDHFFFAVHTPRFDVIFRS
nr:hypothetical protein [Microcystis sp. M112S1]